MGVVYSRIKKKNKKTEPPKNKNKEILVNTYIYIFNNCPYLFIPVNNSSVKVST